MLHFEKLTKTIDDTWDSTLSKGTYLNDDLFKCLLISGFSKIFDYSDGLQYACVNDKLSFIWRIARIDTNIENSTSIKFILDKSLSSVLGKYYTYDITYEYSDNSSYIVLMSEISKDQITAYIKILTDNKDIDMTDRASIASGILDLYITDSPNPDDIATIISDVLVQHGYNSIPDSSNALNTDGSTLDIGESSEDSNGDTIEEPTKR